MEERKDMISVIIPVYNGQDYLENCIKSLEEQTFKAFEIVIVNAGSTDGTGLFVKSSVQSMKTSGCSLWMTRGFLQQEMKG